MGSWNGLALQTEFSAALNDTTAPFKARVLGWMNDVEKEIAAFHDWAWSKKKGSVLMTSAGEEHNLFPAVPTAPTLTASTGAGTLTLLTAYSVRITFFDSVTGFETQGGATVSKTLAGTEDTIAVSAIPISTWPSCTGRKVYLSKAGGSYLLYSTISDNTTTTATILVDTTSTIEPPEFDMIRKMAGSPFLTSQQLTHKSLDQLRMLYQGTWGSGTPEFWDSISEKRIVTYPKPSSALTLSCYYYQIPINMVAESTSIPTIPVWLKDVLEAGVMARGYNYRDRDGKVGMTQQYYALLKLAPSRMGEPAKSPQRVRDVVGDCNGWEY